ncbi:MAG: thioredoxin family protein [Pseudomonadota bacterium]
MRLIATISLLLLAACSRVPDEDFVLTAMEEGDRPVVAALSYAKWCPSCRVLDPRLAEIRDQMDFENVTFVTLDYTKKDKAAFHESAAEAGVGQAIRDRFGDDIGTGMLILIDADTQEWLGELHRGMDGPEIYAALINATYHNGNDARPR